MNFTVNRKQFLSALKISAQAVNAKNILPIMECLKLDMSVDSDILTITGSNEEFRITNTCQMVDNSGVEYSMCVSAKDFVDAVGSINDDLITISTNQSEGIVEIQYKRGKLSYPFYPADEYPTMPTSESNSMVSIPEEVLAHLIGKTIKFVGNDEIRPVMNGVNFNIGGEGDGIVVCVGANDSKLCKVLVSDIDTSGCSERQSFILPNKACQVVSKTIPSNPTEKMVNISFSEKNLTIKICQVDGIGGVSIFARCIEGRYANYNAVIPKDNDVKVELSKADFLSAIGRVSKSFPDGKGIISMGLMLSSIVPEISLKADNLDMKSSGKESLDCSVIESCKNMTICLNKDVISTAVSNASTPNIRMSFSDPTRAILIEGFDGDEGITMLVMPYVTTN